MDQKIKLGKVVCRCKRPTLYLEMNERTKTITGKCPECGWSAYAKKGEEAHRDLLNEVGYNATQAAKPGQAATPPVEDKPAKRERPAPAPFDLNFGSAT